MSAQPSRKFAVGAALFLGAAMAVLSYDHGLITAERTGTPPPFAYVVPLLADGMFILSTASLYDAAKTEARRPRWAILGLLLGGGVTVAMNLYAGWSHGLGGRLVYSMPPIFLVVAIEILVGVFRRPVTMADLPQSNQAEPPPLEVAMAGLVEAYGQRPLERALGIPRSRLVKFTTTVNGTGPAGSEDEHAIAGDHLN